MKSIFLLSILLLSFSLHAQKTSKRNKSKTQATEVNPADGAYEKLIFEADKNYEAKNYVKAKELYQQALSLRVERYPQDKIFLIERIIAKEQAEELQSNEYTKLIAAADKAFAEKNYVKAKEYYNRAVILKPSDPYPKNKLAEVEAILMAKQESELQQLKSDSVVAGANTVTYRQCLAKEGDSIEVKRRRYLNYVAAGDKEWAEKNYGAAKTQYADAVKLFPDEQYPKQKILECDKMLAHMAAEKNRMAIYDRLIKEADILLVSKKYNEAKAKYTEALVINPTAVYPKNKISEIEVILKDNK